MSYQHPYILLRINRDRNKEIRDAMTATRLVNKVAPREGIIKRLVTLLKNGEKSSDEQNALTTQELRKLSA